MAKIIDYEIFIGEKIIDLEEEVMKAIRLGWQPLGAPILLPSILTAYQAMVKYGCEHSYIKFTNIDGTISSHYCTQCGVNPPIDGFVNKT